MQKGENKMNNQKTSTYYISTKELKKPKYQKLVITDDKNKISIHEISTDRYKITSTNEKIDVKAYLDRSKELILAIIGFIKQEIDIDIYSCYYDQNRNSIEFMVEDVAKKPEETTSYQYVHCKKNSEKRRK